MDESIGQEQMPGPDHNFTQLFSDFLAKQQPIIGSDSTVYLNKELFSKFVARYTSLGKNDSPIPLEKGLFAKFYFTYEKQWHDYYLQILQKQWAKTPEAKLDPALYRGDELELFRPDHETVYSNWLAWLLSENSSMPELLQENIIKSICPKLDDKSARKLKLFKVTTEAVVEEGIEGHSGRLDILLVNDEIVIVIENKIREPGEAELIKHDGYQSSIEKDPSTDEHEQYFILLVPKLEDLPNSHGFTPASWKNIAGCLRELVMAGQFAGDKTLEVLAGLFVAAIEHHILGFPVQAWRSILRGDSSDMAICARMVASSGYYSYLEGCYADDKER
jgi:hypothetical protein